MTNDDSASQRQLFAVSPFTINLSHFVLNNAEISLLDKGLTFIPTLSRIPIDRISSCVYRNVRGLQLRDFFQNNDSDYDPNAFTNRFRERSTWVPPPNKLTAETNLAVNRIHNFAANIYCKGRTPYNVPHIRPTIRLRNFKHNLTPDETRAIKDLKNNPNLVIKGADKGGAVVIMDRALYEAEGLRQLSNPKYYREIYYPLARDVCVEINNILGELRAMRIIDDGQLKFLTPSVPDKCRAFYLLPKVHKPRHKWPHPFMPEGRPIVADSGSETERVAQFIDYFLQPLACTHPAYVKDTYHFIKRVRGQIIPQNAFLVTGDVTALYTNMDIDLTISTIRDIFAEFPDLRRPDAQLLRLLELTLRNNDFEFAGRIFLQICGTAMGKRYAPSLANIFLRKFDHKAVSGFLIKPLLYLRFLDDIHFVWTGTRQQLAEYELYLNNLIPGIKVTLTAHSEIIEFLDVLIYKIPHGPDTAILQTRVFFKPTDTHQLLHGSSYHPKHTTKGILKSQILRFKRISSCWGDFHDACTELFNVLRHRGYSRTLFRKTKNEIWRSDFDTKKRALERENNDGKAKQIWPIIHFYDSLSTRIARFCRTLFSSLPFAAGFRLINCYCIHDNLRRILVRSRYDGHMDI